MVRSTRDSQRSRSKLSMVVNQPLYSLVGCEATEPRTSLIVLRDKVTF